MSAAFPTAGAYERVRRVLAEVEAGMRSVRSASRALMWTDEEVQMAVWGEIRQ